MTRLFLVRHGETSDLDTEPVYKGTLDIPLSQRGILTVRATAAFLERFPVSCVYTSALSRAVESGRLIAHSRGLPLETTADLNELHFGLWQGLTFQEVRRRFPEQFNDWWRDPVKNRPPAGEPLASAKERIMARFAAILERHRGECVVLATHGGTIRVAVCSILGLDMSRMFSIQQDNGCVNIIDVYDDGISVVSLLNFTPSLLIGSPSAVINLDQQ